MIRPWALGRCRCLLCGHTQLSMWPMVPPVSVFHVNPGEHFGYLQCEACFEYSSTPAEPGHILMTDRTLSIDFEEHVNYDLTRKRLLN